MGTANYQYNPSASHWTFTGNSGIQSNYSAWGVPNAPEGTQTAFIQGFPNQGTGTLGSISQSVNFPTVGTYAITFQGQRRYGGVQPLRLTVDGVQVGGLLTPAGTSFGLVSSSSFLISTIGSHNISLSATDNSSDLTTMVDLAMVVPVAPIGSFSLTTASPTVTFIPGGNGSTGVTIAPTGGFTGVVALTAKAFDAYQTFVPGITAVFNPNAVSLPDANSKTTAVTISATNAVPVGTYTLTITGTDSTGTVSNSTTVTVKVSPPQVTVTLGSLQTVYVGIPVTTTATASVDFLPGGYTASDLVATWSYSTIYLVYSATGNDEAWNSAADASASSVTLNGSATSPVGTFNGIFNTLGHYEACIGATVNYHNPTTGENFGPYTGYDFASNGGASGNAVSSSALGVQAATPAGTPTTSGQKDVVTAAVPTVSASATSVKLGLGSLNGATSQITETITSASSAGDVTCKILKNSDYSTSSSEATITQSAITTTGNVATLTLTLTAVSETPASTGGSADAAIVPEVKGKPIYLTGSTTPVHTDVLVLVPASVQIPAPLTFGDPNHIVFIGNVTGSNVDFGQDTSPPDYTVPVGYRRLYTQYGTIMTITVLDQFGKQLDKIFSGTAVTEGMQSIKQAITGNGTYSDPVAELSRKKPGPSDVLTGDTITISDWLQASVPAIKTDHQDSSVGVEIGGQVLSPAIAKRGYYAGGNVNPPNNFMISWPDPNL